MTDDEMQNDRMIIEAATPGPWEVGEDQHECAATLRASPCIRGKEPELAVDVIIPFGRAYSDARMIASARTRWPAALDEIERLRRLLDKALRLTHIVGANGGMSDKDHKTEVAIRREAGI